MKLSRFTDFSGNIYICYDIENKILDLAHEGFSFKNSGTVICS